MSGRLNVFCTFALLTTLAGCNGPVGNPGRRTGGLVPDGAKLAASGKTGIAHFTSGGASIYVVDETDRSLVFSGAIPADAMVVIRIDRDAEAVVAEGAQSDEGEKPTTLARIDKTHRFSIWTTGEPAAGRTPTTQSVEIAN